MFGFLAINCLFVTQPNLMGHFAGRIDPEKPIGRQQVTSPLCTNYMTTVSLNDCILTQWPLIVLKSRWVDSEWAEVNGNIPGFFVVRQTFPLNAGVRTVLSPLPIQQWRSDAYYAQQYFGDLHLQLFIYPTSWRISQGKQILRVDIRM